MKTVLLPQRCCSCLGSPETLLKAKKVHDYGTIKETLTLEIPICYKCFTKLRVIIFLRYAIPVVTAIVGLIIGLNIEKVKGDDGPINSLSVTMLGAFVGYVIGGIIKFSIYPVYLDSLFIKFRNKKFQRLYIELNSKSQ
jgi:hypothetical protein